MPIKRRLVGVDKIFIDIFLITITWLCGGFSYSTFSFHLTSRKMVKLRTWANCNYIFHVSVHIWQWEKIPLFLYSNKMCSNEIEKHCLLSSNSRTIFSTLILRAFIRLFHFGLTCACKCCVVLFFFFFLPATKCEKELSILFCSGFMLTFRI